MMEHSILRSELMQKTSRSTTVDVSSLLGSDGADARYVRAMNRLAMIQHAVKSNNISDTCKKFGTTRPTFYRWKARFEKLGFEGLLDKQVKEKKGFTENIENLIEDVITISTENPGWGCNKIAAHFNQQSQRISPSSVHNILESQNLSSKDKRVDYLERQWGKSSDSLTAQQVKSMEKYVPGFRDRDLKDSESTCVLDCFYVKTINRYRVYIQIGLDTHTNYLFASLHRGKYQYDTISLLDKSIIPFYIENRRSLEKVVTPSSTFYSKGYVLKDYLSHKEIEHQYRYSIAMSKSGILMLPKRHITEDIISSWRKEEKTFVQLREELQSWLVYYNHSSLEDGYPMYQKSPHQISEQVRKAKM